MLDKITNQAYVEAVKMMFSGIDAATGMSQYCQFLQALLPSPVWEAIPALGYSEDFQSLVRWFSSILADEPPPSSLVVFYFGLSDMGDQMGISGFRGYTEDEDGPAELTGTLSWPKDYDSGSRILKDIHQIAYSNVDPTHKDKRWIGETCLPIVYAGLSVAKMIQVFSPALLLSGQEKRYVAVCFDEGEFFFLGEVTSEGWNHHNVPSWLGK
jgi:hypothetical protein